MRCSAGAGPGNRVPRRRGGGRPRREPPAVDHLLSSSHWGLNLFGFEQRDIIRAVPVAGLTTSQFRNSGEHTIHGIEVEGRWQATSSLRLYGNFTVRTQDDDNFRAFDEPDQDAYLRADWGFRNSWNWNLQTSWIGERSRPANDPREPMDDYFLTDTTIRYSLPKKWEFAASIRNLFDVDAREYTARSTSVPLAAPDWTSVPGCSVWV